MNKLHRNIIILACIPMLWFLIGNIYHGLCYDLDDYSCVEMCRDQRRIFENMGIKVNQKDGFGGYEYGHTWLELDFGLFKVPWESTLIMPMPHTYYEGKYDYIRDTPMEDI